MTRFQPTASVRSRYFSSWRNLVAMAHEGAVAPKVTPPPQIRRMAVEAKHWTLPTANLGDAAACTALAHVAYAFSYAGVQRRETLAPGMVELARIVGAIVDLADHRPDVPERPFRADIDG